jgi:diguanylate cyclase (GGDEF)-like protein/PAS domain S-box-containing protein
MNTIAWTRLPQNELDASEASPYAVTDQLPCVAFRLRGAGTSWPPAFSYVSAQSRVLLGVEPHTIVLNPSVLFERIPEEDAAQLQAGITHAFATMGQWQHECRLRFADTVRWFECRGRVHRLSANRLCADGYLIDITERKAAELKRAGLCERFMRVFEAAPQPMAIVDEAGNITALNDEFVRTFGYSPPEVPTLDACFRRLFPDEDYRVHLLKEWSDAAQRFMQTRLPQECIVARAICNDGSERTVEARTAWASGESIVILTDVTERLAAQERLRLWASVLEQTTEGIVICDPQQRILTVNPAFERLTGFSQQEALGKTPGILHSGRQGASFYTDMWRTIETTGQWSGEIWNRRKHGELYVEWLELNAVYDPRGRITHYFGIFSDITERKAKEERLRYLAQYDALTDLPNRSLLLHRLEQLIELAARSSLRIAVLFMDLDCFKAVNDSLGHEAGDLLLQTVARRIRSIVRHSDTVARMGGDEFVILLSGLHQPDDAARLAEKLLAAVRGPLMFKDQELSVSASIGICVFPDDGAQAGDLIRNADTAMYRAKSGGRNRYEFYAREMNAYAVEKLHAKNALRLALDRREFVLHYQPQIDLASGAIVGAEALIRWNRPGVGLVLPDQFIPLAQKCGLILAIGNWVVVEALRQLKAWDVAGVPAVTIAVNVSASEFHQRGFVESLAQAIHDHAVEPARLELELTESVAVQDIEATTAILDPLHELGVRLALDDFGTGYSSLNHLKRFRIDKIKIDRSFIGEMTGTAKSVRLVRAISALGRSLTMKVIAEGVESREQLAVLRAERCDEIQGYLVSPALESAQFEQLLRGWQAWI